LENEITKKHAIKLMMKICYKRNSSFNAEKFSTSMVNRLMADGYTPIAKNDSVSFRKQKH